MSGRSTTRWTHGLIDGSICSYIGTFEVAADGAANEPVGPTRGRAMQVARWQRGSTLGLSRECAAGAVRAWAREGRRGQGEGTRRAEGSLTPHPSPQTSRVSPSLGGMSRLLRARQGVSNGVRNIISPLKNGLKRLQNANIF